MTYLDDLHTPWTLHFDRNGTEDFAIICDNQMDSIATSRFFWLPEPSDPIPATLASMRLMTAAPELFDALTDLLEQTIDMDLKHGIALTTGERLAKSNALKAIKKARAS